MPWCGARVSRGGEKSPSVNNFGKQSKMVYFSEDVVAAIPTS